MLRSIGVLLLGVFLMCGDALGAGPPKTILVFGDSLSAAYGIDSDQGWVSLLQKRLTAEGYGHRVVNASVSGETTSGGRARLPRALATHKPDIVILELGANDGLRGLPLATAQANLDAMASQAKAQGARLLLLGIQLPPNYGPQYATKFRESFVQLAKRHSARLVPFLMDGVALDPRLMQADGLHPNAAGQPRLLDNVWPVLKPLLRR
jgi:acyl-CoA thioesterase-1